MPHSRPMTLGEMERVLARVGFALPPRTTDTHRIYRNERTGQTLTLRAENRQGYQLSVELVDNVLRDVRRLSREWKEQQAARRREQAEARR